MGPRKNYLKIEKIKIINYFYLKKNIFKDFFFFEKKVFWCFETSKQQSLRKRMFDFPHRKPAPTANWSKTGGDQIGQSNSQMGSDRRGKVAMSA